MRVTFTHNNGRTQDMDERYAKVLGKLKRGTYQTRDMVAMPPSQPQIPTPEETEPSVSPAARELAEKNNIDLAGITGTGKNGRVTLRDVEAMIPSQDA